jgi:hypothetical protein
MGQEPDVMGFLRRAVDGLKNFAPLYSPLENK